METKTAGDLMIPIDKYPKIMHYSCVRDLIKIIQSSELEINGRKSLARAALVFDDNGKLLGMVRRRDILRGLEPDFMAVSYEHQQSFVYKVEIDPDLLEMASNGFLHTLILKANLPVSEVMVPIKHTINHDEHLTKIIYEMNRHGQSMLPVMKNGAVIGVLRTVEVITEISNILNIRY